MAFPEISGALGRRPDHGSCPASSPDQRRFALAVVLVLIVSACARPASPPVAGNQETDAGKGAPCGPEANVGVEFETYETNDGTEFEIHLINDEPGCLARTRGWIEIEPEPIEGLVRVGLPFFASWDSPTGGRGDQSRPNQPIASWILVNRCDDPILLLAARFEVMASAVFDSSCADPTRPAVLTRLDEEAD